MSIALVACRNRKPFNVTLIHPSTYVHSLALKEAADYVSATLLACGYPTTRTVNQLGRNAHNIIFCAHMLRHEDLAKIPSDSIIFNSEQLEDADGWHLRGGSYREMLSRFFVWDYSPRNLDKITHQKKCLIPFRYCKELQRPDMRREQGSSLIDGVRSLYSDPQSFGERSRAMLDSFKQTSPVPAMAAAVDRFFQSL